MKDAVGANGWQATTSALHAGYYAYRSCGDYMHGEHQAAVVNWANAGREALSSATHATAAVADHFRDAAIDGVKGAALAAVQTIPGANVAVDAGEAVYKGYQLGKSISNMVAPRLSP